MFLNYGEGIKYFEIEGNTELLDLSDVKCEEVM